MIELLLQRRPSVEDTTLGVLYRGTTFECYTLEDVIREIPGQPVDTWKVRGKTAIPAGRYRIGLVTSPRFGPQTMTLLGVPGFDLIRIHAGNDDADTEGCLLVGRAVHEDPTGDGGNLVESRAALAALKEKVVAAIAKGDAVWITVRNPEGMTP